MMPVTVYVSENKLVFINELLKNLHFELEIADIPEWHKSIIDQRLKEYEQNRSELLN
jgi:hypothetical protein